MRITSSGSVGIGTTSPNGKFTISDGSSRQFEFYPENSTDTNLILNYDRVTSTYQNLQTRAATHQFLIGGSEKARIDSSGNLLVGKTSASSASIGFQAGQDGFTAITRASAQPLVLNRTTNDGIIAEFKRDSTQVGNIGCPDGANGSQLVIAAGVGGTNTGVGLRFTSFTVKTILPCYDDGSNHDDEIDLGTSSARFDDIYATNGTIQTSDRNDKQDIEEITDAETRVAVACKGLIRKFRWKSAVAEKDDNSDSDETARIHFGIIAQDLQDAFTAEGLDAGDYAMFTSQTWEDSDGVEQTRLGVRYSELLAFIIAAI